MKNILEIENLSISTKLSETEINIVDGISLSVSVGEVTGLIGESGSGKSITALAVMGLLPSNLKISSGSIKLDGLELTSVSQKHFHNIRGKIAAMIFQEPMTSLNPVIKIGEQIAEVFKLHCRLTKKDAHNKAVEALSKVGIGDPKKRAEQYPYQLSGGMRQRVMIAMALASEPKLLIADEPTTALDVTVQAQILELLHSIIETEKEKGILFISHNIGVVSEIADKAVVIYSGRDVESGDAEALLNMPQHPYTEGLIASMPKHSNKSKRLCTIPGQVPRPIERLSGCSFRNRCSFAKEICSEEISVQSKNGYKLRCIKELK